MEKLDKKVTVTMAMADWFMVFTAFGLAMGVLDYVGGKDVAKRFQEVTDTLRGQVMEQTKEVPKP